MTELRALPDGWRWVKLGDACRTTSGGTPSRSEPAFYKGNIPWIKSGELNDNIIYESEEMISSKALSSSSAKLFPSGTLLIAMYGATVGKLGILNIEATTNQAVCAIFPSEVVNRNYLFYFLRYCRSQLIAASFGGAQPNISQEIVRNIDIPIPFTLAEQQRIAARIEAHMAEITIARAAAEAELAAAEELAAAYLHEVFESDELIRWETVRLGDTLRLRKDVVHPRNSPTGQAVFVGLEHIQSGTGIRSGAQNVEMSQLTGRKPRFYKGDIVYGYLRPYLNKVWIAEFEGLCSVDQYVYSVRSEVADTAFIAWFMRSPTYLTRAPIDTTPGQLPRIRTEEVASVEVNLPPAEIQRRISSQIDQYLYEASQMVENLKHNLDYWCEMPAVVLDQAFNGEL